MLQTATPITDLPDAMIILKEMQSDGVDLFGGYRPLARRAMAESIEAQMPENGGAKLDHGSAAVLAVRAEQKSSIFFLLVSAGRARRYTPWNFTGRSGWRAARG